jgi:hypothetical protein
MLLIAFDRQVEVLMMTVVAGANRAYPCRPTAVAPCSSTEQQR